MKEPAACVGGGACVCVFVHAQARTPRPWALGPGVQKRHR